MAYQPMSNEDFITWCIAAASTDIAIYEHVLHYDLETRAKAREGQGQALPSSGTSQGAGWLLQRYTLSQCHTLLIQRREKDVRGFTNYLTSGHFWGVLGPD